MTITELIDTRVDVARGAGGLPRILIVDSEGAAGLPYARLVARLQPMELRVEKTPEAAPDTLARLKKGGVSLVCVNRKLDCDYSDGMEVIRQIKSDDALKDIPVMLISNYEEHQMAAVSAGAVERFGKLAISNPGTVDLLKPFLE